MEIKPIAVIENRYKEKFGIPRQSGKVKNLSRIVFAPEYRSEDALRGIEGFRSKEKVTSCNKPYLTKSLKPFNMFSKYDII